MALLPKPLAVDIFCGLGGWTQGFLAAGWEVVGFDIERHAYGDQSYPGQLVLQDALTIHGRQFREAACIVASPPCTEFSYMSFPWRRSKQIARALRGDGEFPAGYNGSRTPAELTALFDACFRIQREASAAAGRHIPMVVENVRGAQPWVSRARHNYGSYYLWGDVPALMPFTHKGVKVGGIDWSKYETDGAQGFNRTAEARQFDAMEAAAFGAPRCVVHGDSCDGSCGEKTTGHINRRDGHGHTRHLTNQAEHDAVKHGGDWFSDPSSPGRQGGVTRAKEQVPDPDAGTKGYATRLGDSPSARHGSKSNARKAASARIARIPYQLAYHIAQAYYPR